jgi:peptide deformylase
MTSTTPPNSNLYPILLQPHKTLSAAAEDAPGATPATLAILEKMLATLYRADGVGLAAPQVNVSQRLFIMDIGDERADGKRDYSVKRPTFFINPLIVWESDETTTLQEGCLSLPGLWGNVTRPSQVKVRYTDRDGQTVETQFSGLASAVVQHEIDHLDGIIFPQRMSKLRRDITMGKWINLRKDIIKNGAEFDVLAQEAGIIPARQK